MRLAVISDVHANLAALESVLEAIDRSTPDEVWCLGDMVGYGAEPDACTDLVRERCDLCLVGNHDLAVLGALDIASFSEAAAEAVTWTRETVEQRTIDFLDGLDPSGGRDGIALFHASPRDPVWEYVLSTEQADACLKAQPERTALIGHSHVALFFTRSPAVEGKEVRGAQATDGTLLDLGAGEWLVNPGSVGQPRDGDPRAAWLELDTETGAACFRRTAYDVERSAASILSAGLPQRLAERLHAGL
ncbi:MAG TPA: metallophosphoesterase family protein [Solirubrobacterales bacterium]|jgi:diadenosine tetraphosphatase ApaH/serine/threonine PP2A family protein phosphatase